MDGAVMEGPLFLQGQRFGAKVDRGGGTEPHQSQGWAKGPGKGEGQAAGGSAARGAESPVSPHEVSAHCGGASAGFGVRARRPRREA